MRRRRFSHRTADDVRILSQLGPDEARDFDAFLARQAREQRTFARHESAGTEGALDAVSQGAARLIYGTGGGRKRPTRPIAA